MSLGMVSYGQQLPFVGPYVASALEHPRVQPLTQAIDPYFNTVAGVIEPRVQPLMSAIDPYYHRVIDSAQPLVAQARPYVQNYAVQPALQAYGYGRSAVRSTIGAVREAPTRAYGAAMSTVTGATTTIVQRGQPIYDGAAHRVSPYIDAAVPYVSTAVARVTPYAQSAYAHPYVQSSIATATPYVQPYVMPIVQHRHVQPIIQRVEPMMRRLTM